MAPPKKAPKASRPTRTGKGAGAGKPRATHTALGVAKRARPARGGDTRTARQRAAETARLEKTLPALNGVVPPAAKAGRGGGGGGGSGAGRIGGRGKIGKVFVDDHDTTKLLRLIEQAAGKQQVGEESRLERAVCFAPRPLRFSLGINALPLFSCSGC